MKVGDYVRTKTGINKITNIKDGETQKTVGSNVITIPEHKEYCLDNSSIFYESEVIKSSPNIIDLIEVGDLVYVDISPDDCGGIIVPRIAETENELNSLKLSIKNKDYILKSITTHEQIESMEYKVKE